MLQIVMRPSIESARDRRSRVFDGVADAAVTPNVRMMREDHVLRHDAVLQRAVDADPDRSRLALRKRLRGEHVLDFGSADAPGERAEGAERGRMAVAADERAARERQAELRGDDVHDALARIADIEQADAVVGAVLAQEADELGACREARVVAPGLRRQDVVLRREGLQRACDLAPGCASTAGRPRRC